MPRLHVAAAGDHVEAAVAPFVPDRGQKHSAVAPISGQNRQQADLDEVSEIVHGETSPHTSRLTRPSHWSSLHSPSSQGLRRGEIRALPADLATFVEEAARGAVVGKRGEVD